MGSSLLNDFLAQLPIGLIVMFCGGGLALYGAVIWFTYLKPRRNRTQTPSGAASSLVSDSSPAATGDRGTFDSDDMPDLDLLLNPAADLDAEPVGVVPQNQNASGIRLNTGTQVAADRVVSVLRDPRDGKLIVEVDGVGYRSLVDEPEVKAKFVKVMKELSQVVTQVDDGPTREHAESPVSAAPDEPLTTPEAPKYTPPLTDGDGAMPGDLPRYDLENSVKPQKSGLLGRSRPEPETVPELNIAASIEAYLQHKLRSTSDYAQRHIHVHSAPGGGVRIQVDDRFYDTVGEVEDPEVRSFIADTIEEWQERQ
jgi:hypothetical protein